MPNLRLRGIHPATLADLQARASSDGSTVNALVLRSIDQRLVYRSGQQRHADLDALAGSWNAQETVDFAQANFAFGEVDAQLWN